MFQDLGHAFVRYNLQQHDITNNPHAHTHTSERRPYFKLSKTTILVTLLQVTFTAAHSLTGITILMIWSDQQCWLNSYQTYHKSGFISTIPLKESGTLHHAAAASLSQHHSSRTYHCELCSLWGVNKSAHGKRRGKQATLFQWTFCLYSDGLHSTTLFCRLWILLPSWRNRLTNCSFTYRVHLQLHSITLVCRLLILLPTWTNLTNFNFTSHTWTFLQALDSAAHMEKSYKVHDYISCLDTWNHQPKHTSSIFQINWMANICLF